MTLNTSDRKSIRAAEKASRLAERVRGEVIVSITQTEAGRRYLWDLLTAAHIFTTSWHDSPNRMAFLEGERNSGLQLLNDIMRWCPDQFTLMMREENVRRIASDTALGQRSGGEDADRGDSGPSSAEGDARDDYPYSDSIGDEDGGQARRWQDSN